MTKMKSVAAATLLAIVVARCTDHTLVKGAMIAAGQMPNLARDRKNNLHLVYGKGDSIMYSFSSNDGKNFSKPTLVAVLPGLAASHMRGPQIAPTFNGPNVIACTRSGD